MNNSAKGGGALAVNTNLIDYCSFTGNNASSMGGAIFFLSGETTISNTLFLENKAPSSNIVIDNLAAPFKIKFAGYNNWINAILGGRVPLFSNVTYWNGKVTNTDVDLPIGVQCPGITIVVEVSSSSEACKISI